MFIAISKYDCNSIKADFELRL